MQKTIINGICYYSEGPLGIDISQSHEVLSDDSTMALFGWTSGKITLKNADPETISFLINKSKIGKDKVLELGYNSIFDWMVSKYFDYDTIKIQENNIQIYGR